MPSAQKAAADKNTTKKKKVHVTPQEKINKVWCRFAAPKLSRATAILPPASTATRSLPDSTLALPVLAPKPDNLLVSEDYERAVQECRTRVRKLIKECQRVNMRYRDPDFDIDWDLEWERGYCLNGIVKLKFGITRKTLADPNSEVPKTVKRVHEIFDKPTFLKTTSSADIKQGKLGDCWLMASLTGLANTEFGLRRICVEYDQKIGIYGFVFHRDGEWIISIIDDKLYLTSPDWDSPSVHRKLLQQIHWEDSEREYRRTYQTGSQALYFAQNKDQNETWLPLLEKAYAKAHGDFASLDGGRCGEGIEDLTGGVAFEFLTSDILDRDEFWTNEIMKVNEEFLFSCSTGIMGGGTGSRNGIVERHSYVLMEARTISTGERLVKMRNPWGGKRGNWEGAWSDGSKEFTPELQLELNHKSGHDSVFWISYEDLLRKYQRLDRTRLFMDSPDWRISQKWISVDVPWKAEFQQKFKIVLKKESPIVIVLSQLDDRYFTGLQENYLFRLHFRVHELGTNGENDYIVRSHGNYQMQRSVSTELKSLPAGSYSVFIMVAGTRYQADPSVEAIVKAQCASKNSNDKLIQVGISYDLAHRKAASYTEGKLSAQKLLDKAKAREARNALRKKNWEKRRLRAGLLRKQKKKDAEKREQKKAQKAAKAKDREEKEPKDKPVQTKEVGVSVKNKDQAVQTDDRNTPTAESEKTVASPSGETHGPELNKGAQTDAISTVSSQHGVDTPQDSTRVNSPRPGSPLSANEPKPAKGGNSDSEGESSASPISDRDDLISDNEPTLRKRIFEKTGFEYVREGKRDESGTETEEDTEDGEDDVEPWNAACIVGLRVYSQDEGLVLSIFEDGQDAEPELKEEEGGIEDEGTDADVEDGGDEDEEVVKVVKTRKAKDKVKTKEKTISDPKEGEEPTSTQEPTDELQGEEEVIYTPKEGESPISAEKEDYFAERVVSTPEE